MKRKRGSPLPVEDNNPSISEQKRQTKLYEDDDNHVQLKIGNGKSESEIIRRYVRKGIKMERLERAARDPYIRNLLQTFGEIVEDRTSRATNKLENRLATEVHTLRRLVATSIVLNQATVKILEGYVTLQPPPDAPTLARRRAAFFEEMFNGHINEAEEIIAGMMEERSTLLRLLSSQGTISDELDQALDHLTTPAGGDETAAQTTQDRAP